MIRLGVIGYGRRMRSVLATIGQVQVVNDVPAYAAVY